MRLPQFAIIPVCCVFIAACSSSPEVPNKIVSQFSGLLPEIMENDSALFHGIALGMTPGEVKKSISKKDSLGQEEKDYLEFEGHLAPEKDYSYDCTFDEKGLKDMTIDIHLKDEDNADSLLTDFKNYFTKKYGVPVDSTIGYTWRTESGKRPAIIQLQEDPDYMYGKLTIVFYDKNFAPEPDSDGADSLVLP